jgi:prevent-host-death family protein
VRNLRTATISKLKATLSEHIAYVKRGEEVVVTERGKPVARIVPIEGEMSDDARRMDLIKRGIIRPGRGRISPELLARFPIVEIPLEEIERIIAEEREDRV